MLRATQPVPIIHEGGLQCGSDWGVGLGGGGGAGGANSCNVSCDVSIECYDNYDEDN